MVIPFLVNANFRIDSNFSNYTCSGVFTTELTERNTKVHRETKYLKTSCRFISAPYAAGGGHAKRLSIVARMMGC